MYLYKTKKSYIILPELFFLNVCFIEKFDKPNIKKSLKYTHNGLCQIITCHHYKAFSEQHTLALKQKAFFFKH